MNKSESKYFNTAVAMDLALIRLLEKKDLEYISVKEICERAGVHRSTFYLHYETIADLLEETTEYINCEFMTSFGHTADHIIKQIEAAPLNELVLVNHAFLQPYLRYILENRSVLNAFFSNPRTMKSDKQLANLKKYILEPIMKRFHIPQAAQKYWVSYYVNGIMAIIREWIAGGCKESCDEIESIIIQCVRPETALDNKGSDAQCKEKSCSCAY